MSKEKTLFLQFDSFSRNKKKLLQLAISNGDCEEIEKLFLNQKLTPGDIEILENVEFDKAEENYFRNYSILRYALDRNQEEALMTLLRCGVNPVEKPWGQKESFLEGLIAGNHMAILNKVIPFVKNINDLYTFTFQEYNIQTTYLGLCACYGRKEMAKILMDHGGLLRPATTEIALETNEDCQGCYRGSFIKLESEDKDLYCYSTPSWMTLEPWSFAVLCSDRNRAIFFLDQGEDKCSLDLAEMICQVEDIQMLQWIQTRFPSVMHDLLEEKYSRQILQYANASLLRMSSKNQWDLTDLGAKNWEERSVVSCFHLLKQRNSQALSEEAKNHLVSLMLKQKSVRLLRICEEVWRGEGCDITDMIGLLPLSSREDWEFSIQLENSNLKLFICPWRMATPPDYRRYIITNCKELAMLDRLVEVVVPPEKEQVLPFTKEVLMLGKKSAFKRLVKWGLIQADNLPQVLEFIVEHNLQNNYDQVIETSFRMDGKRRYAF